MKLFLLLLLAAACVQARPSRPTDDNQVLQRLPVQTMAGAQRDALRAAQARWRAQPGDAAAVEDLVRLYIAETRISSDPRYLGYALALLQPWQYRADTPPSLRLLRATVLQHQHQFRPALDELEQVLSRAPALADAWLLRAGIQMVRGDLSGARASCGRLYGGNTLIIGMACTAQVDGLNGRAAAAEARLAQLLALPQSGLDAELRTWMQLNHIELTQRLGLTSRTEAAFRALLDQGPPTSAVKLAWADWLLQRGRHAELISFVGGDSRDDGLLLRLAIAETRSGHPQAALHVQMLRDRFAAAALRGDRTHQREEARFALELLGDAQQALRLARENWQVQREPADALLLLDAARAARQPQAAAPVLAWLRETGIEDPLLRERATRLQGA